MEFLNKNVTQEEHEVTVWKCNRFNDPSHDGPIVMFALTKVK